METLIREIYEDTKGNTGGKVADYIPQLAEVNPEMYGVSFCDLNGNIFSVGDSENPFCLQSCVKPLSYCLARPLGQSRSESLDTSTVKVRKRITAFFHTNHTNARVCCVCTVGYVMQKRQYLSLLGSSTGVQEQEVSVGG
jgi:glutaminase